MGLAGCWAVMAACHVFPKSAPTGPPGPPGPPGPGLKEVVIQPAPGESRGRDNAICASRGQQGNLPALSLGTDAHGHESRMLFYFDVRDTGLTADNTLVSAVLVLFPNPTFCAAKRLSAHVYPLTRPWQENSATWEKADSATPWDTPGGDFIPSLPLGGFWVENMNALNAPRVEIHLDPTLVQSWLNGHPNNGFLVRADLDSQAGAVVTFYSRKFGLDPSKRPLLKIIYK
jgi:hypothetical protein